MPFEFRMVDVFTARPYHGNPLAVVTGADDLSTEEMQRFANWMNLSETTFLLPPTTDEADYSVRIFTPSTELPFAGHPTLGTCQVWLDTVGRPKSTEQVVQQCGAGLVPIVRRAGNGGEDLLAFRAPPRVRSGPLSPVEIQTFARQLSIDEAAVVDGAWVDNGPGWAALLLADADAVLAVDLAQVDGKLGLVGPYLGVVGPHTETSVAPAEPDEAADAEGDGGNGRGRSRRKGPEAAAPAFEIRAFFSANGSPAEDPVTGSLNASVAQWLVESGRAEPPYVVTQGRALGRSGRVHISADDEGAIWVGGQVVTAVVGTVNL